MGLAATCGAVAIVGPTFGGTGDVIVKRAEAVVVARPLDSIVTPVPVSPIAARGLVAVPPRRQPIAQPELPPGTFVNPLPGPERVLPVRGTRRFGAERPGDRADECGAGHCGVDLGFVVGTPILAALDGIVLSVQLDPQHRDGKYVRILHADGVSTWYFHLDEIRPGLGRGQPILAGETVGTLGRTGIHHSEPHLHFAMTMAIKGDDTYVDPLPYLREAQVLASPLPN